MTIGISFVTFSIVLFLVTRFSEDEWRVVVDRKNRNHEVENGFSVFNTLWFGLSGYFIYF